VRDIDAANHRQRCRKVIANLSSTVQVSELRPLDSCAGRVDAQGANSIDGLYTPSMSILTEAMTTSLPASASV
jgi:hypothetical protein